MTLSHEQARFGREEAERAEGIDPEIAARRARAIGSEALGTNRLSEQRATVHPDLQLDDNDRVQLSIN